jgi:hypothetical protein
VALCETVSDVPCTNKDRRNNALTSIRVKIEHFFNQTYQIVHLGITECVVEVQGISVVVFLAAVVAVGPVPVIGRNVDGRLVEPSRPLPPMALLEDTSLGYEQVMNGILIMDKINIGCVNGIIFLRYLTKAS